MTRYFVHIAYDGAKYCGWQSQPGVDTVQDTIEEAMSRVLRRDISILGCGRTDTGVHASEYVFHFETDAVLEDFIFRMNRILPDDIVFKKYYPVKSDIHARFNAVERSYYYQITKRKDPFQRNYAWRITKHLNTEKMGEALKYLLGKQDFSSFAKVNTDVNHHFCTVYRAEIEERNGLIVIHISANRFLRNMIRAIVGTLLDVGLGKMEPIEFKKIIELKDRSKAGTSAPANGLFLSEIIYPDNIK
jgi:tRNA pseudouridine38-40 synthase